MKKSIRASEPSGSGDDRISAQAAEKAPCDICRMQGSPIGGHWAWHRFCRAELNPVALYAFVTRSRFGEVGAQIGAHIAAVTGMDLDVVKREIASWGGK